MAKFNTGQSFADGDTVTGAKLNNIIGLLDIYSGVIADQASIAATVSTADLLLIADTDAGSSGAANKVTIQKLLNDTLTGGTFTNANIAEQLTYGTATGNRTISTSAVITNGTISNATLGTTTGTLATITNLTAGTTTSTAANITSGTVQTLTASTATITGGTYSGAINSTTGTIGTLNSTTGTITTGVIPTLTSTTLITTGTGTAAAPAIVPTGDTNTGIFFPAADTIAFSEGGAEAMRIDSSGQIGVGTTSPLGRLEVSSVEISGQTGAQCIFPKFVTVGFAGGGYGAIGYNLDYRNGTNNNTGVKYLTTDTISQLDFENGGFIFRNAPSGTAGVTATITERLRIEATGTLTSQPTYDNTAAGSAVIVTSAGLIRRTSSSLKYKKDIENLDSSIVDNAIDKLRPVWYRTKNPEGDDKSTWSHVGLIAEEVDSVEPRLVRYKTVEVSTNENGERIQTQLENPIPEDVDYAKLSVILLSELKNQKERISLLESRILSLESA
jgi:hypothetical protein